jgi:hypothetical protein
MDVGMSNSVTTAIRDNVRDSTIGKTRNIGKADRATVEQVCTFFYCWVMLISFSAWGFSLYTCKKMSKSCL